jgi:hypothetical protein
MMAFPHNWQAETLAARPLILPSRSFVYPAQAEEVERGALEVLITPENGATFLATCALGFHDPSAPSGVWTTPNPDWLCALSGGYAYLLNTANPAEFVHLAMRPVLSVHALPQHNLLLFAGHHHLLAWGAEGERWQSGKLSWEGITLTSITKTAIHGTGWDLISDSDTEFSISPATGKRI